MQQRKLAVDELSACSDVCDSVFVFIRPWLHVK